KEFLCQTSPCPCCQSLRMAPPAPWLPKDIHGKPTVDTELHARLGSRTGIHFISLLSKLAPEVLQGSSQEEPTWLDLGTQRRKRVRALPNSANSKKKSSASPNS